MPDKVRLEEHKKTSLRGIAKKAEVNKQHRFRDLYRCLNVEFLLSCWSDLNQDAASGVDKVTAEAYAENLHTNIEALVERLKAKRYRAKLVRRCYIPKEKGKERPLGIPALEDKLLQLGCSKLLEAIYESEFYGINYGYRQGRGPQDAVKELTFDLQFGKYGYIVEADVKGFFDNLDHDWLLRMLSLRIDDRAFLNLIRKWLKAGVLEPDGEVGYPETGTPQGGCVSPVLANVYLHYALDLWFEKVVKPRCQGEALICRYADDWVCAFRFRADAQGFYGELPKRLKKFNLEVAPEKTRTLRFSRFHPSKKRRFTFLGFEFYWSKDRKGVSRVKRCTAGKKFQGACKRIKEWIKLNRHMRGKEFFKSLNARLRGHYNYYGVHGNSISLYRFYRWAMECVFKWLNRRSGHRRSFTWETFQGVLSRGMIAKPCITEVKRRRVYA